MGGDEKAGPYPTDGAKSSSKQYTTTDSNGILLAESLTGANTLSLRSGSFLADGIQPAAGRVGGARKRPAKVQGDPAFDSEPERQKV